MIREKNLVKKGDAGEDEIVCKMLNWKVRMEPKVCEGDVQLSLS